MTHASLYSWAALLLIVVSTLCSCNRTVVGGTLAPEIYATDSITGRYDFGIEMGKTAQGGIMMARSTDNGVRLVATSYFGLSLFDLTLSPEGYKLNNCIDFLDKPQIWQLLYNDFSLLFLPQYEGKISKDKQGNIVMKGGKGIASGKITYNPQSQETKIKHKWIGMKITLKPIETKQTTE
ncbi:MAG: hypothetical protein IKM10_02635 [Bacteroidaceae bacterium]|nr:hypothetical protein [Bacteroidaceae bacterium]